MPNNMDIETFANHVIGESDTPYQVEIRTARFGSRSRNLLVANYVASHVGSVSIGIM